MKSTTSAIYRNRASPHNVCADCRLLEATIKAGMSFDRVPAHCLEADLYGIRHFYLKKALFPLRLWGATFLPDKELGYRWKIVGEIDQFGSGASGHQRTVSLQLKYTTEVRRG